MRLTDAYLTICEKIHKNFISDTLSRKALPGAILAPVDHRTFPAARRRT
jgi:hypothetical protein